jgi:hypothetical protein
MKSFTVATVILAMLAVPAHAQARRPAGGEEKKADQRKLQEKQKADDQAYKAALERIPESKEKYDPWGVARPAETGKKVK